MKLNQIQLILFPLGVQSRNNQNDVEIVFNAWKYFRILVTDDGDSRSQPVGILGNRDHLADIGIRVMRDDEAVELVKQKIIDRDQRARRIVLMEGKSLPDWVGLDFGERKAA
ncbi:MAG: hypothetical protein A2705_01990 [Omnitrophica WOR_2 bacterium RIFCSPHIGHO2_01_FULL_52_10]|nr:MAG: hypothetical protein A2705_01990 [Omnitrophica WOR_2 bacterium RIFCSPHIGHO2_01_FULL_52_10]